MVTVGDAVTPVVIASDERRHISRPLIDPEIWAELAHSVLLAEGTDSGELGLLFVDSDEMARLNLEYLGEDRPTDVLSFPLDGHDEPDPPTIPALIGDVVVCPAYVHAASGGETATNETATATNQTATATNQTATATNQTATGEPTTATNQTATREPGLDEALARRVVHGVLHVLGYDHADAADAAVMQRRERELLVFHHRP